MGVRASKQITLKNFLFLNFRPKITQRNESNENDLILFPRFTLY